MGKNNGRARKQRQQAKGSCNPGNAPRQLKYDQCESRLWRQMALRAPVCRGYPTTSGQHYLFVFGNVNRGGFALYSRTSVTANFQLNPICNNDNWLWGDFSGQFAPNAALYKLYGVESISATLTPGSMAGFGSQLGSYSFIDPTGTAVAELLAGNDVPAAYLEEWSDPRSVRVGKPFATVKEEVQLTKLRYLEQERSFLQTINAAGDRDEWDAGQIIGALTTQAYLPGFVIAFPLCVPNLPVGTITPDPRILPLCAIQFHTEIRFQQRRTKTEAGTLPMHFQNMLVDQTFPGYRSACIEESKAAEETEQSMSFTTVEPDQPLSRSIINRVFDEIIKDKGGMNSIEVASAGHPPTHLKGRVGEATNPGPDDDPS